MSKKTYYPSRSFDDALANLSQLLTQKNWTVVDLKQLAQDAMDQRKDRIEFDRSYEQYLHQRQAFGLAQEQRYQRFAAALNAARGAYRNDKAAMASLAPFKRTITRKESTTVAK